MYTASLMRCIFYFDYEKGNQFQSAVGFSFYRLSPERKTRSGAGLFTLYPTRGAGKKGNDGYGDRYSVLDCKASA